MSHSQPLRNGDPERLGGYRLVGRLGEGGQGVVYLGEAADGTPVAVKTLNGEGVNDPDQWQRFVREAEAARQVASFCTAAVLDVDVEATPAYIVSEYVDGPSLSEAVRRDGPLTGGDLNRVAVATATALMAIHEAGIVHRDFKPANVLLGQGGARVIDFGVAQVRQGAGTLTNSSIGTPAYMASEQISGAPVSPATDVHAWGAVMVFAATGRQPFQGDTVPALLHQILNGDPDLSGVPEPPRTLVISAMRKDPAQRPSSTDVLMNLIGRKERPAGHDEATRVMSEAAASVSDPARSDPATTRIGDPPSPSPTGKRGGSRRWLVGAGVATSVVAALVVGILLGRTLDGSEPDSGGSGGSGTADSAEEGSGDESGGDSGSGSPDLQPQAVPEFTEEYDGDWEGLDKDGNLLTVEIEEGERTAELVNEDDQNCPVTITLIENSEDGYAGMAEGSADCSEDSHTEHIELGLVDGFLTIGGRDSDAEDRIQLQPADE
ncbi:serine/threonine-protein kinase [Halostreptopolyspora alba]|uniref:serine/threonine-protein kinase n=1 Tax=Halostreptopolyspora alba TaxID=2487137 RepID=UPI0026CC4C06